MEPWKLGGLRHYETLQPEVQATIARGDKRDDRTKITTTTHDYEDYEEEEGVCVRDNDLFDTWERLRGSADACVIYNYETAVLRRGGPLQDDTPPSVRADITAHHGQLHMQLNAG